MTNQKKILFLGFYISPEEMNEIIRDDRFPSIQTFNFTTKLIKSMSSKFLLSCISAKAVSDYPTNNRIFYTKKKYIIKSKDKDIPVTEIPFINISLFKLVTRFLFAFFFITRKLLSTQSKERIDYFVVYSVHVPYLLIGVLVKKIFKIETIGVWTDPPSVSSPIDSFFKKSLRKLELTLSKHLMKRFEKVIVLSKYLATDFAPSSKFTVIESIYDNIKQQDSNNSSMMQNQTDYQTVAYFGSTSIKYGIKNIVESFELIEDINIQLHIYGTGDFADELKKISDLKGNIIYHGLIDPKLVRVEMVKHNFLINARSANDLYARYSFPSKVTEYMDSGVPLITTVLPGMPEEYKKHIIMLDNNNPSTIALKIRESIMMSVEQRKDLATKAQIFIRKKDTNHVAELIEQLLKS